jgi:hypothetical protein
MNVTKRSRTASEHRFSVAPMMDFLDSPSRSNTYDAPCAECVQKESARDRK